MEGPADMLRQIKLKLWRKQGYVVKESRPGYLERSFQLIKLENKKLLKFQIPKLQEKMFYINRYWDDRL